MKRAWRTALQLSALVALSVLVAAGCSEAVTDDDPAPEDFGTNPFLEASGGGGKEDSQYQNPDGVEVEVDLEADIDAPAWRLPTAPAILGQFAMTHLRKQGEFYLESLAEDASSKERVEWLVDGEWIPAGEAGSLSPEQMTHFRLRGVNAVLLHSASRSVELGQVFTAPVPKKPFSILSDAGDACADKDGHISLSQSIYWYLWNPLRSGCEADLQDMSVTVSRVLPRGEATYPEFDKLVEDGKVTAVVLFGQIGDTLSDSDSGVRGYKRMATWLLEAGFEEISPAPIGRRFSRQAGEVVYEIDLYSPYDFSGLSDRAHFDNFQKALSEHEIVTYDGHSMLGASDFWSRPEYPDFYQIFLYGGCLGYEYYVQPILGGKGGWDQVDILSSVVEVSAGAIDFAGPVLAQIGYGLDHGYKVTWRDILRAVRARVGDSTFGMSGVRDNCFTPIGSRCGDEALGELQIFRDEADLLIPDDDPEGIVRTLQVDEELSTEQVTLELEIEHSWPGDLLIILSHEGETLKVWDKSGGRAEGIYESFTLTSFAQTDASGEWTLTVVDSAARDEGRLVSWSLGMRE